MPPRLNTVLRKEAREMLYSVFCYMKKEAEEAGTPNTLKIICKRTADATKVSVSTVRRILREAKRTGGVFSTPGQKRPRKKPVTGLDSAAQDFIVNFIHDYQALRKGELSLTILLKKVQTDIDFKGSEHSLRRIIKKLGFVWKKIGINRRILVEKHLVDTVTHEENGKEDSVEERIGSEDSSMSEDMPTSPVPAPAQNSDTSSDSCMTPDNKGNIDPTLLNKEEVTEHTSDSEINMFHIKTEPIDIEVPL